MCTFTVNGKNKVTICGNYEMCFFKERVLWDYGVNSFFLYLKIGLLDMNISIGFRKEIFFRWWLPLGKLKQNLNFKIFSCHRSSVELKYKFIQQIFLKCWMRKNERWGNKGLRGFSWRVEGRPKWEGGVVGWIVDVLYVFCIIQG